MQAFEHLRVLDLSKVLAGPLCGQYLGNLGAQVTKVEPLGVGDDTRAWQPQKHGESATFLAVNHNKRSLAVDLKSPRGQAVVQRLAQQADVVLQGFGAGTAARLGVDFDTLSALNPQLVYCEISGYGRDGPLGQEPGYDVMLQAFSGMVSVMGHEGGPLVRATFSPVDIATGMLAFSGVLAALMERQATGQGQRVEVSLLDTAMNLMGYVAQNHWVSGQLPRRMGTGHPAMCPYQAFEAADGPLLIGVGNDAQWRRFCPVVGLAAQRDDPRFATNAARVAHFDATVALVAERVRLQPVQHWLDALRAVGVPCSPIHTIAQALNHPQLAARDLVAHTTHSTLGEMPAVGFPIAFGGQRPAPRRAPPRLGEHSRAVLLDAGYSAGDIDALQAAHIIGDGAPNPA
ncbi:formyl-CoA transferase [Comamonas serinivorans]|uniref:Formyl-CoA transferase n=1 Tax=Comamonas serinivorans TaxID=1082851 RepID=A0A1Y0EPT0_9BURK|nr:CoA transferase [Comamonas serinivorans]ARU05411.1 formyl-CoA transferase [Comamonas serinivorans]